MKLGITLEGGASRTIFSCGVTDALLEENIMPDYLIGVSAGIAYGVSYLSKQPRRNLDIAMEYMADKRYMGVRHLLHQRSFYNIDFVFGEIPNKLVPFDYEEFKRYPGQAVAVVTNIHTGKAEYIDVPRDDESFHLLVASCSLPILFQPVKVGKRYYLDGGIADSIPYKQAIKAGCDKNIVVLTRERGYVKHVDKSVHVAASLYKKYPNMAESLLSRADRYNACVTELMEREKRGEVFVIAPKTTFGVKRTEKHGEPLKQLYEEGYKEMKEQMDRLREYLES